MKNEQIEVGGLLWSPELLSGGSGILNPDNGLYYYTQNNAIKEANNQGLRLPADYELEQFCLQTMHQWVDRNGLPGMLFTDMQNGNSIFIPASGHRCCNNGSFYYVGIHGGLWSSSVYDYRHGYDLYFNNSGIYPQDSNNRQHGFPVLCVVIK